MQTLTQSKGNCGIQGHLMNFLGAGVIAKVARNRAIVPEKCQNVNHKMANLGALDILSFPFSSTT